MEHSNAIIESIIPEFKSAVGSDYDKYKNHVYRVFLNCLLIDSEKANEEKYVIAAVFHDIGIWTNHTFDYLNPSIVQAKVYLTETGKSGWTEEISLMINWHHKISRYKGAHEQIVETFRKADLIDVPWGLMTFKVDQKEIKENRKRFPNSGFHWFLIKASAKNLFRHPLNPLPMFKR